MQDRLDAMRAAMARQAGTDRTAVAGAKTTQLPAASAVTKVAGNGTASDAAVTRPSASTQQTTARAAATDAQPSPASAPARAPPPSDALQASSSASATQLDRRRGQAAVLPSPRSTASSAKEGKSGGFGGMWLVAAGPALVTGVSAAALLRQKVPLHSIIVNADRKLRSWLGYCHC